jgi:(2Fe-2S) ferredoxin
MTGLHRLDHQPTQLVLEGRYLGSITSSKGRPKYLRLQTDQGEQLIKLPDYVGYALAEEVESGAWVRVWVRQKGEKLKAVMVIPLAPTAAVNVSAPVSESRLPSICKIQVCRKGGCCKRGGLNVWQALQEALQQTSGGQRVHLEASGCMKECKHGPNIRVGSAIYSQVRCDQIPEILQTHLSNPVGPT